MTSIRRADRKLRRWERYLRRYRTVFADMTIRSQPGHQRAWEALSAARSAKAAR
ncbi:hypothetical protein [Actinoplanes rectilineatus]|uniref:hypothetical protein n=1 Tax=Actinoplanes rectilineatus TaxID=113571 RepID=UPI000A5D61DD|nr:hypothetical protein [Actinoplanes rectilineatus]